MLTCLDGCSIVLEIMRESLLKAGKRKEKKVVVRTGIGKGTETKIGTETGIEIEIGGRETEIETETETEKKNVTVTTEIGTGIAVREGRGVEIEMRMMITIEAETTRGGEIMIETGKISTSVVHDLVQKRDLITGQGHDLARVPRAKGSVVLTWRLLLLPC